MRWKRFFYFTHSLPLLKRRWAQEQEAKRNAAAPAEGNKATAGLSAASIFASLAAPHGMLEFLQYPGETVFVPRGWLHAAVSQNFVGVRGLEASWLNGGGKEAA